MRHYPHHIGDFNSATRHLTRVERSLYRDLIDLYYDTEQPLNGDFDKLARRVICDDEDKPALRDVLNEFFVELSDGWHNARCDDEIAKYQGQIEQASRAGKASAAKRYGAEPTPVERPLDSRCTNQNQEPRTKNQEPKEKKSASAPTIPELSESLMADFLKVRKAKAAPLTETAIAGIRREADKAGLSMVEAITECVECNWQGFRADWHAERKGKAKTNGNAPANTHKYAAAARTIFGNDADDLRTFDA